MMHFGKQTATQRKCRGVDAKLILKPYKPGCDGGDTPHHLIPGRCLRDTPNYVHDNAPCICVNGRSQHMDKHRDCHEVFDPVERWHFETGTKFKYSKAKETAAYSAGGAMEPPRELTEKELECIKMQLDEYYKKDPPGGPGLNENSDLRASGAAGKVNEHYEDVETAGGTAPLPE
jgi:hypothetical protein